MSELQWQRRQKNESFYVREPWPLYVEERRVGWLEHGRMVVDTLPQRQDLRSGAFLVRGVHEHGGEHGWGCRWSSNPGCGRGRPGTVLGPEWGAAQHAAASVVWAQERLRSSIWPLFCCVMVSVRIGRSGPGEGVWPCGRPCVAAGWPLAERRGCSARHAGIIVTGDWLWHPLRPVWGGPRP